MTETSATQPSTPDENGHSPGDPMLVAALDLAARDYAVFPLAGKFPALREVYGGRGHHDATTDPRAIRAMWSRFPRANIGIRPNRGVVVLDIDPRDSGAINLVSLCAGRQLPPTRTANTGGADHGLHIWYRMGLSEAKKDLCPGVQLKAHTGYLVAPPSIHPISGCRYTWANDLPIAEAPDWLVTSCQKAALTRRSLPAAPTARGQHRRLAGLLDTVLGAPDGERNCTLFWASCRAGEHIAAGRLDHNLAVSCLIEAATAVGLSEREATASITSGIDKTVGTQ